MNNTAHYKKCRTCEKSVPVEDYYRKESACDGLQSSCKACCKAINKKAVARYRKAFDPENVRSQHGRKECWECKQKKPKADFGFNRCNPDGLKSMCKQCSCKARRQYRAENREKDNAWALRYYHERLAHRQDIKLYKRSLGAFRRVATARTNRSWVMDRVPYTAEDLIDHLKSCVPEGHTWTDFLEGRLQLDHIKPYSSFCLESPDDPAFAKCWALDNIQLLTQRDNVKKSNKSDRQSPAKATAATE